MLNFGGVHVCCQTSFWVRLVQRDSLTAWWPGNYPKMRTSNLAKLCCVYWGLYDLIFFDILLYFFDIILYIFLLILYHIILYCVDIILYHIILCCVDITSYHIIVLLILHHIILYLCWYYIISYHIVLCWYYIISYYIVDIVVIILYHILIYTMSSWKGHFQFFFQGSKGTRYCSNHGMRQLFEQNRWAWQIFGWSSHRSWPS